MKKSYHSSEVPTRLATMTRRTDEACWVVPRSGGIGAPRGRFRSMLIQHKPDHVPAQQEGTHSLRVDGAMRRGVRPSTTTNTAARGAGAGEMSSQRTSRWWRPADQARECPDAQVRDTAVIASAVRQVQ